MRDDIELTEEEGCLCILNGHGDTTIKWNKKKPEEVEVARKTFDILVKEKKYAAFSMGWRGNKKDQVTEFDPDLGKVILFAPMAGGEREDCTIPIPENIRVSGRRLASEGSVSRYDECTAEQESKKMQRPHDKEAAFRAYRHLKETLGDEAFLELMACKVLQIQGQYGTYSLDMNFQVALRQEVQIGPKTRPIVWGLCISPTDDSIPEGDRILALYLSITRDEDRFVQTANFRRVETVDEFMERNREGQAAPDQLDRAHTALWDSCVRRNTPAEGGKIPRRNILSGENFSR